MRSVKNIIPNVENDKPFSFVAFKSRHLNEEIEGIELYEEIYGKEKVRTLHVLLVLCLNLAVDPPDVLAKVSPCAKTEAWLDPKEKNLARALEVIGKNLQNQYERWQPKARYRQSLDPTIEEVHRLCQSLRRSARDERFLFHYNGHGVPRPTENGEIWVFNKTYTKYIPLSLYDLQSWMGGPSVYVFDCNNAGRIIRMMETFSNKRQETNNAATGAPASLMETNIILAACRENEDIPINPEIPADLFTSCLTTPIKMALHWHLLRSKVLFPGYLEDSMLDLITGSPSNRVSMFGEINWVFTAVTDTIAWSCLPTPLFQRLFRQDLLVASLFRNFLLAERIMHFYGVRPQSYPVLPHTHDHPMWDAWDHALDGYMCQLPDLQRQKNLASSSDNLENLPIIPHPPDDPPSVGLNNPYINDSSDDDDDDIEDDEDSTQLKSNSDQMIPRSLLLAHDFSENGAQKTERYLSNKNVPARIATDIRPPGVQRTISQSSKGLGAVKGNGANQPIGGGLALPDYVQFRHTDFFNDHMTAFELWLKTANEKKTVPMQLPILLQVLLSQVHRSRALRLISEYMDLGQWAVEQCLTVGIFPYVIRLLQSPVSDVKPFLVFIWGKIISSAQTDFAKNDVVKEAGYKYFVSCLTESEPYEIIVKTIAVFALAKMLNNNSAGQKLYIKQNITTVLISELENNPPDLSNENYIRLRIWFILCFAKLWSENDEAKWYGVRQKIQEKLFVYLKDISPEVRAATVYALGTFLNNKADDGIRSKHSVQVEQHVCQNLLNISVNDSSPLVRAELVVTMKYMVNLFSSQIVSMSLCHDEMMFRNTTLDSSKYALPPSPNVARTNRSRQGSIPGTGNDLSKEYNLLTNKKHSYNSSTSTFYDIEKASASGDIADDFSPENTSRYYYIQKMKQLAGEPFSNHSSMNRLPTISTFTPHSQSCQIGNIYSQMWGALVQLSKDPHPRVSALATEIVTAIRQITTDSAPSIDTSNLAKDTLAEPTTSSPKLSHSPLLFKGQLTVKHSALYPTHKHKVDLICSLASSDTLSEQSAFSEEGYQFDFSGVNTDFFNWSCRYFTQPLFPQHKLTVKVAASHQEDRTVRRPECLATLLDKSRSFDKGSIKRLPDLGVVLQRPQGSQQRLMHIAEVADYEDFAERTRQQTRMREEGARSWREGAVSTNGSQLSQVFLQRIESRPELLRFHPYLNYLAVADSCGVSLWNWESGHRAQYMLSQAVPSRSESSAGGEAASGGCVTSLEFINCAEERGGLLLVGTMDGRVKVWRNYLRDMGQDPDIVTAWHATPDQIASERPAGLVTHWSQPLGQLALAGDVRYVRLWDSSQECRILDMATNCESCVTSLDRTGDGRLLAAGFGDGHVKVFDVRAPANESTITAGLGDLGWVHRVAFAEHTGKVHSAGTGGELASWCLRQRQPVRPFPVPGRRQAGPKAQARDGLLAGQPRPDGRVSLAKADSHLLKAQPVHCADFRVTSGQEEDHLSVVGAGRETRGIFTASVATGNVTATFKFFEGFSRANIEAPTAVCVHPYQNLVGAGLDDCNLLLLKLLPR